MHLNIEDLNAIAKDAARRDGWGAMETAAKKELIHYLLFDYLDRAGFLDVLVFQGGTCLRDCYGADRLSEDLNFNVPRSFSLQDLAAMTEGIATSLHRSLGTAVTVKPPRKARVDQNRTVPIATWMVAVETNPGRPDIPRQHVKIKVAQIPAYDIVDRFLDVHYNELPSSLGDIIIRCESREEICADKLVSFALSPYERYRDVWDLQWLLKREVDVGNVRGLVIHKLDDYQEPVTIAKLSERGIERLEHALGSDHFQQELERFLPQTTMARTLGRGRWRKLTGERLQELYRNVASWN